MDLRQPAGQESGLEMALPYVGTKLLPITVYPWLYFWFPGQRWLVSLSWLTVIAFMMIFLRTVIRLARQARQGSFFRHIGAFGIVSLCLAGTALLPLSLGMYPCHRPGHRLQASLFRIDRVLVHGHLVLLSAGTSDLAKDVIRHVGRSCGYGRRALLGVELVLDVGTQQVAARDGAAKCAAKRSPLTDPAIVSRRSALAANPLPFPHAVSSDEFQVRTLSFPSGAMLLWLSHREANSSRSRLQPLDAAIRRRTCAPGLGLAFADCVKKVRIRRAGSN